MFSPLGIHFASICLEKDGCRGVVLVFVVGGGVDGRVFEDVKISVRGWATFLGLGKCRTCGGRSDTSHPSQGARRMGHPSIVFGAEEGNGKDELQRF
jgi:hypothetical protein